MIYATAIGRLTNGATMAQTKSGKEVVNFSLATSINDVRGDEKGVQFIYCIYFGKMGIVKYLEKGRKVAIYGTLEQYTVTDQNGFIQTQYKFVVRDLELLERAKLGELNYNTKTEEKDTEPKKQNQESKKATQKPIKPISNAKVIEIFNDSEETNEIPF